MNRRELLKRSAAAGFIAAAPFSLAVKSVAGLGASARIGRADSSGSAAAANPLKPPKRGTIAVAYPLSRGVVDIDFTGPWAIFGSVMLPGDSGWPVQPELLRQYRFRSEHPVRAFR
jgi:hypothetical protein